MSDFIGSWAERREGPGDSPGESPDSAGRLQAARKKQASLVSVGICSSKTRPPNVGIVLQGQGHLSLRVTGAAHTPRKTPLALPAPSWRQSRSVTTSTRQEAPPSFSAAQRSAVCVWNTGGPTRDSGTQGSPPPRGSRYTDSRIVLLSREKMLLFEFLNVIDK